MRHLQTKSSWITKIASCTVILLGLDLIAVPWGASCASKLNAQTPWETAPAQPATLPTQGSGVDDRSGRRDLPPPPKKAPPVVRWPAYVPYKQVQEKAQAAEQAIQGTQSAAGALTTDALKELEARLTQLGQGARRTQEGFKMAIPPLSLPKSAPSSTDMPSLPGIAQLESGMGLAATSEATSINLPVPNLDELPLPAVQQSTPPNRLTSGENSTKATLPSAQTPITNPPNVPPASRDSTPVLVGRVKEAEPGEVIKRFEPGKLVAVVGAEHILAGDLAHYVEPVIKKNKDRIRSQAQETMVREQILRQVLKNYVVTKAMHIEFFRDAAGAATPDKLEESKKMVTTRAREIFFEKQVPDLMKKYEVSDFRSLEAKLRENSMGLANMQKQFVEQVLASELERKYIPHDFEFSRQELFKYYDEHRQQWAEPAKARWQQLTVRFDKHGHNRAEVEQQIKNMGNEIYLGGKTFEAVAKQSSEGFNASRGGLYEWTAVGSLKSKPVEQAVFSIEPNRLSKVIVDDIGMHIVQVLGREEAKVRSFAEAQKEIRETLSKERRNEELTKFRKTVLDRTPIWSLWPEDIDSKNVRPLTEAMGDL